MLLALIAMHVFAVLVPAVIALHSLRPWLRIGFASFSLASIAELLDHTQTFWVYVNRVSVWNGVFYAALAAGLACLTAAMVRSKIVRWCLLISAPVCASVYFLVGKEQAIIIQALLSVLLLRYWWREFHDPLLWLYPIFAVMLTTGLGALLAISGDPIWHIFIGPCGSLGLIVLWLILQKANLQPS